jgi:hypothetical protein
MKPQLLGANMKKLAVVLSTLMLVVSFQNCSQQKLSAKSGSASESGDGGGGGGLNLGPTDDDTTGVVTQTGGPNCRDELHSITTPIRPVFIVDVSGSNKMNNNNQPGSDPNRIVRGDSIERFYNTYKNKGNFNWSFSTFAGNSATILLAMGNSNSMNNAINTFRNMGDSGETPYIAALNAAKNNIAGDTNRPAGTKYMVVFLSDGLPNPAVNQSTLNAKVAEILAVVPGAISFNSVYYGAVNNDASDRLKLMAQAGAGNFLDTNANPTGKDFLITDLVVIPGINCN